MRKLALLVMLTALILITPQIAGISSNEQSSTTFVQSDEGLLPATSYVWQEINGLCAWAATAMAMQYAGVQLDLHDVLAATTVGFSFAYFQINDTLLMFPGALYTQAEPTKFLADLYGVNYTIYLGDTVPYVEQNIQVWESEGLTVGIIHGEDDAFDLMRTTIDSGYPLLVSVDPTWLPASDYDILREADLSGGGHGILIVGYNDTEGTATIIDPGVGSFGDDFGYPIDGRGNYTKITYTALNNAWSNRYYISNTFLPSGPALASVDDSLGPLIRDKLLGVGTIYSPNSANAYYGKFGEMAFRTMSEDMDEAGIKSYLNVFDGIQDEVQFKSAAILFIGLGLEAQVTLQYLSYRAALASLPTLMTDTNLSEFIEAGDRALPYFEEIVDNSTLIYPTNFTQITGYVATTFKAIAESYNATGNIDAAFAPYSDDLNDICANLLGIADSWRDAGLALEKIWPNNFLTLYGPVIAFAGGAIVVAVVVLIWWTRKKPSQ
ncbi:MAG: C39 family peptidase [Candidatus Thorarchaeota archaeon]|nr:C39 family peptidase [Candidatus Thorarchaeota archaeon]